MQAEAAHIRGMGNRGPAIQRLRSSGMNLSPLTPGIALQTDISLPDLESPVLPPLLY